MAEVERAIRHIADNLGYCENYRELARLSSIYSPSEAQAYLNAKAAELLYDYRTEAARNSADSVGPAPDRPQGGAG